MEHIERELLAILEEAMKMEREAADRYRHGMDIATQEDVKIMFQKLVQDEENHERILRERYYQIKKKLGLKIMKDE